METLDVEGGLSYDVRSEHEVLARRRHSREILGKGRKADDIGKISRIVSAPEEHFHMDAFEVFEVFFHDVSNFRGLPFPVRDSVLLVLYERTDRFEVFFETRGNVRLEENRIGDDDSRRVSRDDVGEPGKSSAHVEHVLAEERLLTGVGR